MCSFFPFFLPFPLFVFVNVSLSACTLPLTFFFYLGHFHFINIFILCCWCHRWVLTIIKTENRQCDDSSTHLKCDQTQKKSARKIAKRLLGNVTSLLDVCPLATNSYTNTSIWVSLVSSTHSISRVQSIYTFSKVLISLKLILNISANWNSEINNLIASFLFYCRLVSHGQSTNKRKLDCNIETLNNE